jgi:cyclopropane-fatty-acyl-phospholipid synthase
MVLHRRAHARAASVRGSLGAAEAYIDGAWSCGDVAALIRIMVGNESVLRNVEGGWARLNGISEPAASH